MLSVLCALLLLPSPLCSAANESLAALSSDDVRQLRGYRPLQKSGVLRWKNHPSKCLDVRFGQAKNGNTLQLWDCNTASSNQQFSWSSQDGKLRWATNPTYCVDVRDHRNANGNRLQLWECIRSNSDQSFSVPASGEGHIQWSNHPDKCLDVQDHGDWNGNVFQIWSCGASNSDQQFIFGGSESLLPTVQPEQEHPGEDFDVIVVGGGLMGSAVAARLAAKLSGFRVALLEAGRASHASLGGTEPPASWDRAQRRWINWGDNGGLQVTRYDLPGNYEALQCWDRRCPESWLTDVPYFQCKVLGGCGVMNGALVQRPNAANMETWPSGWRMPDLEPYYKEAEALFHITETPSRDGRHYLDNTGAGFARRALEKAGFVHSSDLTKKAGSLCIPAVTAKDGLRQSTASQLLPEALGRENFELHLETHVLEVLHEAGVASGVRVKSEGRSKVLRLRPNGLLVLSAGALNTPRLLLSSGLRSQSLGEDLSDHTLVSLKYRVQHRSALGANESFGIKPPSPSAVWQYAQTRSGPLAQYGPVLTAFLRDPSTSGPADAYDIEIWVNPISAQGEVHVSLALMRPTCSRAAVHVAGGQLQQRGQLYLGCDRDKRTMAFALEHVDKWLGAQGAQRFDGQSPPEALHHFGGSCALGRCVDPETLRLKGTTNLAVADASLLPGQVWGHPFMTLSAMALKAADHLANSFV